MLDASIERANWIANIRRFREKLYKKAILKSFESMNDDIDYTTNENKLV